MFWYPRIDLSCFANQNFIIVSYEEQMHLHDKLSCCSPMSYYVLQKHQYFNKHQFFSKASVKIREHLIVSDIDQQCLCMNIFHVQTSLLLLIQCLGWSFVRQYVTRSNKTRNKSHRAILRYRALKYQGRKIGLKVKYEGLVFL